MSIGGGKQKQSSSSSTALDPQTQAYLQQVMEAAKRAGGSGPSPLTTGAGTYFSDLMKGGNFGMGVLQGDAAGAQTLMNPYQQQVIDANNAEWANTNQRTMGAVNDAATKAGAFGGSRHGVATGVALGENNRAQMGQTAGLLSGGYQDAMGRARDLAGFGFNAAGANANLGMGGVGSPDQWMLQMMRQGFIMPQGSSSQSRSTGMRFGAEGKIPLFG